MPQARSYVLQVLTFLVVLLAGTAAFNAVSDPYGIYGFVCRPGGNAQKPGQKGHDRLVKAYAIRHRAPDGLALGTSRVQYGLDPADKALARLAKRPYNAALLGSNIYLALRYLQHAQALGDVRVAVLGLDPLMFDDTNTDATRDFSETRMAVDSAFAAQPYATLTDIPSTLLSMDATRLSVRTWRKQDHIVSDLTELGQRSAVALARLYPADVSMMDRFLSVDAEYAKNYRAMTWPESAEASPSLQALGQLIDFALAHNIRLEIYFTPEHVHLHEVAALTGHKNHIARLTTLVTQLVHDKKGRAPSPAALSLWQFATLNALTQEAVPQDASRTKLEWFWEPTHAKDNFGHLMLGRMLGAEDGAMAAEGALDVGTQLSPSNVSALLQSRDEALARWQASHADEVALIAQRLQSMPASGPVAP